MAELINRFNAVFEKSEHEKNESTYSHSWGDTDGSRCEKCGDKDYMADVLCTVSDEEHTYNESLKANPIK